MTNETGTTTNTAENSTVGIQAETVHNSNVYIVGPDSAPEHKYEVGKRYLDDGVPKSARDLISDAIACGHNTAQVRFHWVLAMLSKRAYHDLTADERERLHLVSGLVDSYPDDEWKAALRVTFDLLECLVEVNGETETALKALRELPPEQRDPIVRHLDLVLTGGIKDSIWAESREAAKASRFANDRSKRVWAYFEPEPIGPRARPPVTVAYGIETQGEAYVYSGLFALLAGLLWIFGVSASPVPVIIETLILVGAGFGAYRFGEQWWFLKRRLEDKEREHFPPYLTNVHTTGDGFTNRVHHSFEHYFAVCAPHGVDRDQWLRYTTGIRASLGMEISEIYRESRVGIDRLYWLIRYLARDTRDRHVNGSLVDYRQRYTTKMTTKAACTASLGVTVLMGLSIAVQTGSPMGFLGLIAAALSGGKAATAWLRLSSEKRRLAEDTHEYEERLAARVDAYQRWKGYLDSIRPSESEMETWLACDKTIFTDEVLRHYQLGWREIITHTILFTPARPYKRARVNGGPWRYSRYELRLFLVTQDGVREVSTELDFSDATLTNEHRSNYRFDTVSSVQVAERSGASYELELILSNGPARIIRVKDADTHQLVPGENPEVISAINLDAVGFTNTFHLLEGIAADGKRWIDRNSPGRPPHAA
ncbi:hypothetical protein [Saccharopolyspora terrae]|uniref:hypothetical protein n=1 Tax=Saccharopolyspora terrae TaxID=2530384 RepID=UPI001A9D9EDF|nr:hypothetical protein [Saccharopolyspora terrae]